MRIAHGLFLWQEPREVLEPCLRSTAPWVDEIIIAEGLIEGVPDLGLGMHSDLAWLAEPSDFLPDHVHISSRAGRSGTGYTPWPTLSKACTYLLDKARSLQIDWLLYVDADQELHNGEALRRHLEAWPGETYPLRRAEPDGRQMMVPWQAVRVEAFARYVSGCYIVERQDGSRVNLVPSTDTSHHYWLPSAPWLSHHPERRPPWRRHQRLGSLEAVLEPPPVDVPTVDVIGIPV